MKLFYSDSIGEIAAALAKAQGNMGKAVTSSTNPHFNSKYADLSSCLDATIPALNGAGISLTQLPGNADELVTLTTMLMHSSGEYIGCLAGMAVQKPGPHAHGSALTYLRRYSIASICGLAQIDDDGNAGQQVVQKGEPVDTSTSEADLGAAAKNGTDALRKAWEETNHDQQQAIVDGKAQWWERIKSQAADVDDAREAA